MSSSGKISYHKVLRELLPMYQNLPKISSQRTFVPEDKVNIVRIIEYKPYDPKAIKNFKKFIQE